MNDRSRRRECGVLGAIAVFVLVGVAGCGASPAPSPASPTSPVVTPPATVGRLQFTALPIDIDPRSSVSQIGMILGGGVSTKIGFGGQSTTSVYAPATGEVRSIEVRDGGYAVGNVVRVEFESEGRRYALDNLSYTSLTVGQSVLAGLPIGKRSYDDRGRLLSISLSVYREEPLDFFAQPSRYPSEWLHADDPHAYFSEPAKAEMASILTHPTRRPLSFDVHGTLQGQWFFEGVSLAESLSNQNKGARLWFYYSDENGPRQYEIVFPGPNYDFWVGRPQPGFVDPKNVTFASGLVSYRMEPITPGGNPLVLLVQMLPDGTVKAESFDTYYTPDPKGFTSKARIYRR